MDWKDARIGAGVNPGWEPIVDALHERVLALDPDVRIDQVKEKFGGLRYYYFTESDKETSEAIARLVTMAEYRAETTCEVCGGLAMDGPTPGKWGWLNTLCPEHMAVRDNEDKPAWQIAKDEGLGT